jgi:hypothetical protein
METSLKHCYIVEYSSFNIIKEYEYASATVNTLMLQDDNVIAIFDKYIIVLGTERKIFYSLEATSKMTYGIIESRGVVLISAWDSRNSRSK